MRLEEDQESGEFGPVRPNRRCCRFSCTCLAGSLPVIFIWAIIAWSYYVYIIAMCGFVITNNFERIMYIVIYHPILFVFLWTYVQTIFTKPIAPPSKFSLSHNELGEVLKRENEAQQQEYLESLIVSKQLPIYTRSLNGAVRYCNRCCLIKPDRAHHCSTCNQCMLKMDHHCPWVGNCVGFHNYKYFSLFLAYGFVYCLYVASTSAPYFVRFWTVDVTQSFLLGTDHTSGNSTAPSGPSGQHLWPSSGNNTQSESSKGGIDTVHRLQILFLFFIAVMFALSLLGLFSYHLWLTAKNRSTLESFRAPIFRTSGPDKDGFNLGVKNNFREVYGDGCSGALPIFTSRGDGIRWPTRALHRPNYHTMENGAPILASECEEMLTDPACESPGLKKGEP